MFLHGTIELHLWSSSLASKHQILGNGTMHYLLLLSLLPAFGLTKPTIDYASCPPVTGTFTLDAYQLFPESAEWDPILCRLWVWYGLRRNAICGSLFDYLLAPCTMRASSSTTPTLSLRKLYSCLASLATLISTPVALRIASI